MHPLQISTQMNTCALKYTDRHTAAFPYRSFNFSSKGQLNIPELNCSLHSHLSTAASQKTQWSTI